MTQDLRRPVRILLVEDNPGDALMTLEAFEEARIAVEMVHVDSSPAAIAAIDDEATPLPDLVLLDLNLPGPPGLTVLEHIRGDERTRHVPVIVLTSSSAPEDILSAYRRTANSFITKPVQPEQFLDAVRSFENYWLTIVRLPSD